MSELVAEFTGSIPQIQSAFSVGGDQSARLKLDIPSSEVAAVVRLIGYGCGKALRFVVTVEE